MYQLTVFMLVCHALTEAFEAECCMAFLSPHKVTARGQGVDFHECAG
jgi:hypothetical protein